MKELVCIVCPNSCKLSISENGEVTGARCPRGKKFATEELTCPKRTVCTTVATVFDDKIPALMELVNNFTLKKRVARGEVVIENVLDTGVNLISTSNMLYDYFVKI